MARLARYSFVGAGNKSRFRAARRFSELSPFRIARSSSLTGVIPNLRFLPASYLAAFAQVATLAFALEYIAPATPGFGALDGAFFGFVLAVGFTAFGSLSHRMFSHNEYKVYKSIKVWLIEVGQDVLCLVVAGAILGAWS